MELAQTKYKKTEVGLIPEDWGVFQVNDLIDLLTDYDANGSFASVAENVNVFDSDNFAWYVRSTDLEKKSKLSEVRYVDEKSYKFLKKTALYGGELLFLKRGDIGNIYLFQMQTKYATVAPNLYLLKLNKLTNSTYLYYYFKSNRGQLQLKSKNASSTLGALYKDDVKSIYVPLPPTLKEQKAIATALSDVDDLISNLDQLITKKKVIKQGAIQGLLNGNTRLAEFGPSGKLKNTEIGFISEDWNVEILNSLCHFENGDRGFNYPSKSDFKSFGKLFVNTGHLKNREISLTSMDYISDEKYNQLSGGKFKLGDILFCLRGSLGKFAVVKDSNLRGAIASSLIIIRPTKGKISSSYLEFYFESKYCKNMIDLLSGGAAQPNLGGSDLGLFKIPIPPSIEEQEEITKILSDIDNGIKKLESKKAKYQEIKQGMMQELLTGKTRLV